MIRKSKTREKVKGKELTELPENPVVLFDRDDFYALTLEMVLFNFSLPTPIVVSGRRTEEQFLRDFGKLDFKGGIYIFDEFYHDTERQQKLIAVIKEKDKDASFICYTVSEENEIELIEEYDKVVKKTSRENSKGLITALSEILNIEFIADNSDPELDAYG